MMVVVGDSHAGPLGRAVGREDNAGAIALKRKFGAVGAAKVIEGFRLRAPFYQVDGSTIRLNGKAGETIAEMAGTDGGLRPGDGNVYGFSMGFHTAIMLRQESWGRFSLLPEVEGKDFVSSAAYREMVLHDNEHVLGFARALVANGISAFLLAGAPIRRAMIERQAKVARREELLAVQWRYVETMQSALAAIGVAFVPAPDHVCVDGVLDSAYDSAAEDDVHHGNVRFGLTQWRAIAEHFGLLGGSA